MDDEHSYYYYQKLTRVETCNLCSVLVNIHFSKYHIWKRKGYTNTSIRNIFDFEESFHTCLIQACTLSISHIVSETKGIQSVYLSEVLQSTKLE